MDPAEPGANFFHLGHRDGVDEDGVLPLALEQPVEGVDGQVGIQYPEPGAGEKSGQGGEPCGGELIDDRHVIDGAAHLAAAVVQAEIAGGGMAVQYLGLAHIDPRLLAHLE